MAHNFKADTTGSLAAWYHQYGRAKVAGFYPGLRKLRIAAERELQRRGVGLDVASLLAAYHA